VNSDGCFSRFVGRRSHEPSVIGADWPGRRNCSPRGGLWNDQFTRRAMNHFPFASRNVNVDSVPLSKRSTRTVLHGQAGIRRLLPPRKRTSTGVLIGPVLCLLPCSAKVILSRVMGDSVMPAALDRGEQCKRQVQGRIPVCRSDSPQHIVAGRVDPRPSVLMARFCSQLELGGPRATELAHAATGAIARNTKRAIMNPQDNPSRATKRINISSCDSRVFGYDRCFLGFANDQRQIQG